jgi:NADPH:quinone reductase
MPAAVPTTTLGVVNRDDDPLAVGREQLPLAAPAAGEALVAVEAFSVNRGELALLAARPAGWRPGQDVAGRVLVAAADGSGPPAGTRVAGLVEGAGWAEHVAVPTDRLAPLPEAVTAVAAATLGIAGLTALRMLRLGGNLLGRPVLITGASSSVARFAIQLAVLQGAHVTALARRDHAALLALGAEAAVERLEPTTGPFPFTLEAVGGTTLAQAIAASAPGATIVVYGTSSAEPTPISIYEFLGGHEDVRLQTYFSYAQPEPPAADLRILVSLLEQSRLRAPVAAVWPWEQLDDALAAMKTGDGPAGKHVLTIAS